MRDVYKADTNPDEYDSLLKPLLTPFDEDWWPQHGINDWVELGFALDGTPMRDRWKPLPVERDPASKRKHRYEAADFHTCEFGNIALSERAVEVITPLAGDAFEALPLECVGEPEHRYYVFHVIKFVDCLDRERTQGPRVTEDRFSEIRKYEFRPGTTEGYHLFRVPEQPLGPDLCSAEFKHLVESSGLVGMRFRSTDDLILPPTCSPGSRRRKRRGESRTLFPRQIGQNRSREAH